MSGQREKADYLRASSVIRVIHDNNQQGKKERVDYKFNETEATSFTLTYDKAQDLINRLQSAMNDESGTGGVRISMYGKKSKNNHTGEIFNGLGILIYAQKPNLNENGFKGGRGNFNNSRGGGRRDYPPQNSNRASTGNQTTSRSNTNTSSGGGGRAPQGNGAQVSGPTRTSQSSTPRNAQPTGQYDEPNF